MQSNPESYHYWANLDMKFKDVNAMTGIYQCYCRFETDHFFDPIFNDNYHICRIYTYEDFGGGIFITMPFGMVIGMLNNIGAALIMKYFDEIKFNSA